MRGRSSEITPINTEKEIQRTELRPTEQSQTPGKRVSSDHKIALLLKPCTEKGEMIKHRHGGGG